MSSLNPVPSSCLATAGQFVYSAVSLIATLYEVQDKGTGSFGDNLQVSANQGDHRETSSVRSTCVCLADRYLLTAPYARSVFWLSESLPATDRSAAAQAMKRGRRNGRSARDQKTRETLYQREVEALAPGST